MCTIADVEWNNNSSSMKISVNNTDDKENDIHKSSIKFLLLQAFIIFGATFSNLSDGMSTGWVAKALVDMSPNGTSPIHISSEQGALIGTLPMYAVFCSAPISIYSANKIGRKWTILWGSTLTLISWICVLAAQNVWALYVGTFIRGFGGSVIFTVIPMYSAEISDACIRGLLGSFVPMMMNIGVLLSYVTALYWPLWVTEAFGALAILMVWLLFAVCAPYSPYHTLIHKRDPNAAREILCKLHGDKMAAVDQELTKMATSAEAELCDNKAARIPFLELVTVKTNRRITIIVVTLQFIQQLTGVDAILIYLNFLLDQQSSTIIFGVGKLVSCLVSLVLVDRLGRKPLLVFSCITSCLTLFTLGGYFYVKDCLNYTINSTVQTWLPLSTLVTFICCYNIGLGIVPFILGGEMYPTRVKALGVTFGEAMYALPMIITTEVFNWTKDTFGVYLPFWIFAVCSFFGAIFCQLFIIETKGKTLEDIHNQLRNLT